MTTLPMHTGEIEWVPLKAIATRDEWQVRQRLNDAAILRYGTQYRNGAELAPITLNRMGNCLYVVDGWHRLRAALNEGLAELPAVVIEVPDEEAQWRAAEANLQHGVPLNKREHRNVFRAFVKAGKHLKGGGRRLKSFREIAQELHGVAAYTTIRSWMERDFPRIARHYQSEGRQTKRAKSGPTWGINVEAGVLQQHINSILALIEATPAKERDELREAVGSALGLPQVTDEVCEF